MTRSATNIVPHNRPHVAPGYPSRLPRARYLIHARRADTGEEFQCFRWTRDEASGIRRAWADAKMYGVPLSAVWAKPV